MRTHSPRTGNDAVSRNALCDHAAIVLVAPLLTGDFPPRFYLLAVRGFT